MHTFTDTEGRAWEVIITVDTVKRVLAALQINLAAAYDGDLYERLASDVVLLVDVLYVICQPQATKDNVSAEDFGQSMSGDTLDPATTALLEELVDFSPSRRRELLRRVLDKSTAYDKQVMDAAIEKVEQMDLTDILNQRVEEVFDSASMSLEKSTESQDQSESTPDP